MNPEGQELVQPPKYDIVLVHGGNIRRKGDKFVSTDFNPGPEKSFGAHTRSRAAAELYRNGEARLFIVSTGKTHPDPDAPTEAAVMKAEMVRFGVPAECIIEEDTSYYIYEYFRICKNYSRKRFEINCCSFQRMAFA